jgi:hypothetical protein
MLLSNTGLWHLGRLLRENVYPHTINNAVCKQSNKSGACNMMKTIVKETAVEKSKHLLKRVWLGCQGY